MKQTLSFKCDPLRLLRLTMDIFAENLEGKHTKAIQFARYEYLRTMTDDELKELTERYINEQELEVITLEDYEKDCSHLFQYIYKSERYKALEFKFNKKGYGKTGMGVVDNSDNTFYHCQFAHHWQKVTEIIKMKYPHLGKALDAMYLNDKLNEYDGVTREYLDNFITTRFEFTGASRPIDKYM